MWSGRRYFRNFYFKYLFDKIGKISYFLGFYGRPWTTEQRKDLFQK